MNPSEASKAQEYMKGNDTFRTSSTLVNHPVIKSAPLGHIPTKIWVLARAFPGTPNIKFVFIVLFLQLVPWLIAKASEHGYVHLHLTPDTLTRAFAGVR